MAASGGGGARAAVGILGEAFGVGFSTCSLVPRPALAAFFLSAVLFARIPFKLHQ